MALTRPRCLITIASSASNWDVRTICLKGQAPACVRRVCLTKALGARPRRGFLTLRTNDNQRHGPTPASDTDDPSRTAGDDSTRTDGVGNQASGTTFMPGSAIKTGEQPTGTAVALSMNGITNQRGRDSDDLAIKWSIKADAIHVPSKPIAEASGRYD